MEAKFNKVRIAFTLVLFAAIVTSLVFAIVLATRSDSVCVPLFVTFGVSLAYGVSYLIAHRKDKAALADVELAFESVVIAIVFVIALPIALVLWIVELIVEAIGGHGSQKAMRKIK